ncbi:MAG: hypothetical protein JW841_07140 [Deltaproteobacteria bacterium]|nr:hypothetical protein [Deltaproteobacteria bacterium]
MNRKTTIFFSLCALLVIAAKGNSCTQTCDTNADCGKDKYCAKVAEDCAGSGTCEILPTICPKNYTPVCGCDGNEYSNTCYANRQGVNVAYAGECNTGTNPEACFNSEKCGEGNYCLFASCAAQTGECAKRPEACYEIYSPVCGCDGKTYSNDCFAAGAGISVAYDGVCEGEVETCWDNQSCGPKGYCKFASCAAETGVCQARPDACLDEDKAAVCGCDNKTYNNECFAAMAGVRVAYEGECKVDPDPDPKTCGIDKKCNEGFYCLLNECNANSGVCEKIPTICPLQTDPLLKEDVCGCDGISYKNSCLAAASGVNIAYKGECQTDPDPETCRDNEFCGINRYCKKSSCAAESGLCSDQPSKDDCNATDYKPVCSCEGNDYNNECLAAAAGENVDYEGKCKTEPQICWEGNKCPEGNYCLYNACGAKSGTCTLQPTYCPTVREPVCGCNGVTYSNSCIAANKGMSIDYKGVCERDHCFKVGECGEGLYCYFDSCAAETGKCIKVPTDCKKPARPVCGCDYNLYDDECQAANKGISIDLTGMRCLHFEKGINILD